MSLGSVTYDDLVDRAVNVIKSNVHNIDQTKFNNLPDCLKSTYQNILVYSGTDAGASGSSHAYVSITGNSVSKVNDTVKTDLTSFLSSAGITDLDDDITPEKFIDFFNNVMSFCSRYLRYSVSQFTPNVYLIYGDTGSTKTYNNNLTDDLVYAKSIDSTTGMLNVLKNRLSIVVRCYPATYSYSFD